MSAQVIPLHTATPMPFIRPQYVVEDAHHNVVVCGRRPSRKGDLVRAVFDNTHDSLRAVKKYQRRADAWRATEVLAGLFLLGAICFGLPG